MTAADLHPDTREVRPSSCCGVCPPIAGGGWDCTCAGLPGCPANEPGLVRVRRERDAVAQDLARMAARLAAVEALLADGPDTWRPYQVREAGDVFMADEVTEFTADLRAALSAAPTDTTKETDR